MQWEVRHKWATHHGLDYYGEELLHVHLRAVDLAFLQWRRDTASKGATPNKATGDGDNGQPGAV